MAGTEICDKIGIDRRVLSSYECSYDDLELKNKLKKLEEFIRYTKIKREWKKDSGRSRA